MGYRAQAFGKWWRAEAVTGLEIQVAPLRDDSATKFTETPSRTPTQYVEPSKDTENA
ncbi:hypothetical protein E8E12_003564 [Didymella heteroderae]|uniref:Uncharacterized protein n=1 Tax=Didymella heteroderae TaxID=1769908 RepID=A0A9P4WYR6_9PLEO|nr:hypothetical protein E8E12_003564 [Didymella heteroderae]